MASQIIYVDDDAPGSYHGTNWTDAYKSLQDALTTARIVSKPVEIHIAGGTYWPDRSAEHPNGLEEYNLLKDRVAYLGHLIAARLEDKSGN